MSAPSVHRLDGLEADNLLAFLALLGTLRAIHQAQPLLRPRVSWSVDQPPWRPRLHVAQAMERDALTAVISEGVEALAQVHVFNGHVDLNFTAPDCRKMLDEAAAAARASDRLRADLLAALMNDAAVKDHKDRSIDPTPLCLLFGQGHQHFLQRLADVPKLPAPTAGGKGKKTPTPDAAQALSEALFDVWHRRDGTPSFRWDPGEDVRYATMGGDPTDPSFKGGTQHGANRLAAVGLPLLKLAARSASGRVRPVVISGRRDTEGFFSLAWPICRVPVTLPGLSALLSHPDLHVPRGLAHLGVVHVMVSRRISVGKFMNFTRARPLPPTPSPS